MATLAQQFSLTQNKTFTTRIIQGMMVVAFEVIAESPTTEGHPLRVALASSVLNNPAAFENRVSAAVVTDDETFRSQVDTTTSPPTVKVDTTADTALLRRIREIWSLLAGYMGPG